MTFSWVILWHFTGKLLITLQTTGTNQCSTNQFRIYSAMIKYYHKSTERQHFEVNVLLFSIFVFSSVWRRKHNLNDKKSSQSSSYTADSSPYISNRAYDGNMLTCSHTLGEGNSWWRTDLQGVYSISRISIYNINATHTDMSGAQIYIGYSLQDNGTINIL